MKKLLFLLLTILLIPNVKASSSETEVDFQYDANNYSTVTKKISSNITTFIYDNAILDNINEETLNKILDQVNPLESSDLVYYENMKVKINPVLSLEPLKNKDYIYIGQNASWDSNYPKANDMAKSQPFTSNYPIYGFRISYRSNTDDEFSSVEFNDKDYINKSLREKLAFLINKNKDEVANYYKQLFKFEVLNNYSYTFRFDFYGESDSEPVMENNYYYTSSLKLLTTKYVIINYKRTETASTAVINDNNSKKVNFIPALLFFGTIIGGTYYIKKKNLLDLTK